MKLEEIYNYLNRVSPFELQEKWDNSGLIVGNPLWEISKIVLSIDLDAQLIESQEEGVLFIVHHPLIFGGIKSLEFSKYPANLLQKMILKQQSCIAMHTNFDKTHLNQFVFEKILGFQTDKRDDFICQAQGHWSKEQLFLILQERLGLNSLKVVAPKGIVNSVALTTGSGASLIDSITSDCFLTGDIKYHDAMKAKSQDLMMIEIGHYESEQFFGEILADELKFLPLLVIISNSHNPFQMSFPKDID